MIKKVAIISLIFSLSSCSVYKSQFDCKAGKGVGCESVSKVNQLINDDALDDFIESNQKNTKGIKKCESCKRASDVESINQKEKEKMKIRFNEYRDDSGTIYAPHDVYIVV